MQVLQVLLFNIKFLKAPTHTSPQGERNKRLHFLVRKGNGCGLQKHMNLQTEFEFTLPKGYIDSTGTIHRKGVMRLATAMDEITPMRDLRVRSNQAYLVIVLLSRVIIRLGTLPNVTTNVIENLFAADLAYLQAFYRRINEEGTSIIRLHCHECQTEFDFDLATLGG